jgi:uncharacterized protein YbaP (TraB family)
MLYGDIVGCPLPGNIFRFVFILLQFALAYYINHLKESAQYGQENVEDTKGLIRGWKSKDIQYYHDQMKSKTKGQPIIYKTLHRKRKIEQHDLQIKRVLSCFVFIAGRYCCV